MTGPTPGDADAPVVPFSDRLLTWLESDDPKTVARLGEVFAEKAFAVTILILMLVPALPLPTGGISHASEVLAVVVALQMVAGRRSLWLPRRWRDRQLGALGTTRTIPLIIRWVRRLERVSRRRGAGFLARSLTTRLLGVALAGAAVIAFLAPPFSGLDTIPGVAAVLVCLGIILDDVLITAVGAVLLVAGAAVVGLLGAALVGWFRRLL